MSLQNGFARLMTVLWWLLWPVSALLWCVFAYLYFGTNGVMLIAISGCCLYYAFRLMWVDHEEIATELVNSPFSVLVTWTLFLLVPFIIVLFGVLQYGNNTRDWVLFNWVVFGFFAALCVVWWIVRGFFISDKR